MKRFILIGILIVCFGLLSLPVMGQNASETDVLQKQKEKVKENLELIEPESKVVEIATLGNEEMIGGIDWENKVVYAVGGGAVPEEAANPSQARLLAKRAAIDESYARLMELVKKVQVDAESTTKDFMNKNRIVQTKVRGFVKNAEIVEIKQSADGAYQVKMKMPMTGEKGISSAMLPIQMKNVRKMEIVSHVKQSFPSQGKSKTVQKEVVSEKKQTMEQTTEINDTASKEDDLEIDSEYTSLIVNAKGLGVKPALYPVIKTQNDAVVYNLEMVNPNDAIETGMCEYKTSLKKARNLPLAGDNPLVVEAIDVGGKYKVDIIISKDDGKKVSRVNEHNGFLSEAKVIVVVDKG
jgi:hypothetical protein